MSETLRPEPRWMVDGREVRFGLDAGVDTRDAITMMIRQADTELAKADWKIKIMAELMRPQPKHSTLKSPLAIRQVHPEARWG